MECKRVAHSTHPSQWRRACLTDLGKGLGGHPSRGPGREPGEGRGEHLGGRGSGEEGGLMRRRRWDWKVKRRAAPGAGRRGGQAGRTAGASRHSPNEVSRRLSYGPLLSPKRNFGIIEVATLEPITQGVKPTKATKALQCGSWRLSICFRYRRTRFPRDSVSVIGHG